jgi:hypothetical protein
MKRENRQTECREELDNLKVQSDRQTDRQTQCWIDFKTNWHTERLKGIASN